MTLVEAVVGMALLGTMLVAMLLAMSRMNVQSARAERRLEAARVLDGLLRRWWEQPDRIPRNSEGVDAEFPDWLWRTRRIEDDNAAALETEKIAVELFPVEPTDDKTPAASVELLLKKPDQEASQ